MELTHHGIKGQKWGRRRFQNEDGTLTPAGKERYDDDNSPSAKKKSKHRLKLEEKYVSKGMTPEEAEAAAAKRIRTEKIVAGAAALTVAAASAYVIAKNVRERSDRIVKSGTTLQRISTDENENLDRAFYTSHEKRDNTKYAGMYGKQLKDSGSEAYRMKLKANQDIKVVSRHKAAEAFADLYKNDPEFRSDFEKSNGLFKRQWLDPNAKLHDKAAGKMTDRQLRKIGYDAFNRSLVNHNEHGQAASKKFYDKLKAMGYDAVEDINDKKYSGYDAKSPLIVFNNSGKISLSEVQKMTDQQIASNAKKAYAGVIGSAVAKQGAIWTGVIAGTSLMGSTINNVRVNNYRQEHPGSGLSDKEILEALGY